MYWSFLTITPLQWAVLGGIFAVLSLFMPRRIPLTVCCASLITSLALMACNLFLHTPMPVPWQMAVFMGTIVVGLFFVSPNTTTLDPFPEIKAIFTLTSPIQKGKGTYLYDGITYTVVGPDAPIGAQATIVSMKGRTLYIDIISQ